ncbi:zinc finger, matrin-type 2 [Rhizophlyctis rosea]|uniref:Zinc finger, matrin-type 2 n=1 Tax=Rhizophlyctis rosea TaxID=64517 RepID=A0AAD5SF95_9FUNG|nr:zinc finger, matrin-type 2 [Rhizophlyctis rosea]
MSSQKGFYSSSAGDTDFRRKWDRAEYEKKAQSNAKDTKEREKDEERKRKGLKPKKKDTDPPAPALLQLRDTEVDLSSKLNKTEVVTVSQIASKQPGYYCDVCDCTVKDSVNYLDHINGKKHQQMLGMSMRVERSTADQVRARLERLKRKADDVPVDLATRVERAKQEEEEEKRLKKEKRKERKKSKRDHDDDEGSKVVDGFEIEGGDGGVDMAALMGFGSFGSSK